MQTVVEVTVEVVEVTVEVVGVTVEVVDMTAQITMTHVTTTTVTLSHRTTPMIAIAQPGIGPVMLMLVASAATNESQRTKTRGTGKQGRQKCSHRIVAVPSYEMNCVVS